MQILSSNLESCDVVPSDVFTLRSGASGEVTGLFRTGPGLKARVTSKPMITLEAYIGEELSLVPEVETVYVEGDKQNGKGYRVIAVINRRDPQVRAKVYSREQAIMDEFQGVDFSFRVISRTNREMADVIEEVGRLVYQRR